MYRKTRERLRGCTSGEFMPGQTVRYMTYYEMRYWRRKGWIVKKGDMFVLTKLGWDEA